MSREALIANPPFFLTALDIATLRQSDEEFTPYTWQNIKDLIASNTLDGIVRTPSDLENYIHFTQHVKATHGNIVSFILQHKLHWQQPSSSSPPSPLSPTPFASPLDYKILRNDWPYGTTSDINHLVVWLKTPLPLDEASGEPTEAARGAIEEFVKRTFRAEMEDDDSVVWFRNPSKWQTVRAVEHFHVFVRGAGEKVVRGWTGQDEGEMEVRKWKDGKRMADSFVEDKISRS